MRRSDIIAALRSFRRQPLPSLLVAGVLTLGIAANVVVFSLMNGLFFRPFPFGAPDRLVYVNETAPKMNLETTGVNFPDYAAWRSTARAFGIALYDRASLTFADVSGAEPVDGALVTRNFADVLGIKPLVGRMFTEREDLPRGRRVAVISELLWRRKFGAATDLAGKTLRLNGVTMDVAGCCRSGRHFPRRPTSGWRCRAIRIRRA